MPIFDIAPKLSPKIAPRFGGLVTLGLLLAIGTAAASAPQRTSGHYRDLNHNRRLDPYEDRRLPAAVRVRDLIGKMTVEEKVGAMLHGTLPGVNSPFGFTSQSYDFPAVRRLIEDGKLNSFLTRATMPPVVFAEQNNAVQRIAQRSRLGIPLTISTDPRNHFQSVAGASTTAAGFSLWPETLGLAAIGSAKVVRNFGRVVAGEYRAVGIHMALSPQADIASEPRWSRGIATFGSNPLAVSDMGKAYVEGFQGGRHGPAATGVATITKHWVGYGAEPDGYDAHNHYGRIARLTNDSFQKHLSAFSGPLRAHTAGVMPTYAIITGVVLDNKSLEPVGAGFSHQLLTDLLRRRMKYDGLVVSDWGIVNDCPQACFAPSAANPQGPSAIGMPWGVEDLSIEARYAKAVNAGIDQFGGVDDGSRLLAAVRSGQISMTRLNESVARVMLLKFQLGLFDQPYVSPEEATRRVGSPKSQHQADVAQRNAQVLLENKAGLLPLAPRAKRVWLFGVSAEAAIAEGLEPVKAIENAEFAIIRMGSPAELFHPNNFFGARQGEGRLDFRDGDLGYEALKMAAKNCPTVVAIDMDRPAILTNIRDKSTALLALFGATDRALIDIITGRASPRGKLPIELPSSMAAVRSQDPAEPDDSVAPLYQVGAGLRYPN